MSLFSVCNCWWTQCPDLEENYDVASLLCARFGLESSEKDYVLVGSQTGYLSVFYPTLEWHRRQTYAGNDSGDGNIYSATDLLLEAQFAAPILGLYAGRFSNARTENGNQLAVLQPNSVSIYQLQTLDGVAEHGTQLYLQPLVEYRFERVAVDFCKGHFGQVKGREFFCVVHMDGTWTFYEQDGISYECDFIGHPALPAPVAYCERTDSFIRFSALWHLECFTYQDLAHSAMNKSRYQATWSVCIGEGLLDLRVVQVKQDYATILLLGERNFFALRDNGRLEFILKLDYVPKCFCAFVVGYYWEPGARLMSAIASDDGRLCVYHDSAIVWGAQYRDRRRPVALQRANINGLPGALVTLNADGQLLIGYLGSEPHHFELPVLSVDELSFGEAYKQLLQLEEEIREAVDTRNIDAINQRAIDDVSVQFSLDEASETPDMLLLLVSADVAVKELLSCKGRLRLRAKLELLELQVCFNLSPGVRCSRETLSYVDLPAGWSEELLLDFYIDELQHIHSARVELVISFICTRSIPRVLRMTDYLPLRMLLKPAQPQKSAALKLTLTLTAPGLSPRLSQFFPEFVAAGGHDSHALGLQLLCPGNEKAPELVTLVTAKNSNRLRVQSDSLEAFPLVLERLTTIAQSHVGINVKGRGMLATPTLPVQQILHSIDVHHETQENIRSQTAQLDALWQEFKTLQRRLQEKSEGDAKETLVMQIEEIYDQLIAAGDKLTEMRTDERKQRCDLNCAIGVATQLIAVLPLEEKIIKIILSVLSMPAEDWTELSWEESMAPGIDMLHHYGPLSRAKNDAIIGMGASNVGGGGNSNTTTTHDQFDFVRFRRYLVTFFERLVRLANAEKFTSPTHERSNLSGVQLGVAAGATSLLPTTSMASSLGDVPKGALPKLVSQVRQLEVVEDNEDEELSERQDRKNTEPQDKHEQQQQKPKTMGGEDDEQREKCEWVNDEYELPTTEDLFTDLGIWW